MGRITAIHHKEFEKVVKFVGCHFERQTSSHLIYKREDLKRPVIIPKYKSLPVFIIKNNLRILGLSNEDYLKILESV